MDRPDPREIQLERSERARSSTLCSLEAHDLMRQSPQGSAPREADNRPGGYPPNLVIHDEQRAPQAAVDNAALQQQASLLFNPNASAEQKLACVQGLANAGLNELSYNDQTGQHKLRLEKVPVGADGRAMVHLFGTDENGQQRTILRGIAHADGSFEHERDQQGQQVDFYGKGKDLLDQPTPPTISVPAADNVPGSDPQIRQNPFHKNLRPDELYSPNPNDRLLFPNGQTEPLPYDRNGGANGGYRPDYGGRPNPYNLPNPYGDYRYQPDPRYGQDQQFGPNPNRNDFDGRPYPYQQPYRGQEDCPPDQRYGRRPPEDGYRPNPYQSNPYRRNPGEYGSENDQTPRPYNGGNLESNNAVRSISDRNTFYAHQNDGYSCSAFSMAMMGADWNTGRSPSDGESSHWKRIAGTLGRGYRGSLDTVAQNLQEGIPGLHTKVYNYGMGRVGQQAMQDLNKELAAGHTAVAKVINPHTGNAHYIYIAGRSENGGYILGDPDRKNPHQVPISGDRLQHMMSPRDGFVAGWKDTQTAAANVPGTAAYRYAQSLRQRYGA